jgi:hypothetical protein
MRFRDGSDKGTESNSVQILEEVWRGLLAMIRQSFGEVSISCTRKVQTHPRPKKARRGTTKSRACLSFSLISGLLFTRNPSWQAKQSIPHTTVTFYGDSVKMREDIASNFGDKRTGCCIMTTHRLTHLLSPGNLWPKTWLAFPTHPTFLCFPDWR